MTNDEQSKPVGRPTSYTEKLAQEICAKIVEGYSLRHIGAIEELPSKDTILRWCREDESFRNQYAHAKELQADTFAEELLDIVDDGRNDWIERENKNGSTYIALDDEAIARSRLRTDTRKWLMGKMRPKKYGDSSMLKVADNEGGKLECVEVLMVKATNKEAGE